MTTSPKPVTKNLAAKRAAGVKAETGAGEFVVILTRSSKREPTRLTDARPKKELKTIIGNATSSRDNAQAYLRKLGILTSAGNVAKKYSRG